MSLLSKRKAIKADLEWKLILVSVYLLAEGRQVVLHWGTADRLQVHDEDVHQSRLPACDNNKNGKKWEHFLNIPVILYQHILYGNTFVFITMAQVTCELFRFLLWHTLLEHCCVHHRSPVLPNGCLLPSRWEADIQQLTQLHVVSELWQSQASLYWPQGTLTLSFSTQYCVPSTITTQI